MSLNYSDSYFRYLFILMKYGAGIKIRRLRALIFMYLDYEYYRYAVINNKRKRRIDVYAYKKSMYDSTFVGEIHIIGYYPKQVRKILFNLNKRIENDEEFRELLSNKIFTISRDRSRQGKRYFAYLQSKASQQG